MQISDLIFSPMCSLTLLHFFCVSQTLSDMMRLKGKQASSARRSARLAFALCLAQYPDMDLDTVTSGMPEDADDLALLEACQGFDQRLANCVTHSAYYDIYDLPAAAKERERLAEEAKVNVTLHLAPRPTLFVSCLGHEHHITMMSFMILILAIRAGIAIVAPGTR